MTSEFERKDHQLYWEGSDDAAMPRSSLKSILHSASLQIFVEGALNTDRIYYYEDSPSRGLAIVDNKGNLVSTYRFE